MKKVLFTLIFLVSFLTLGAQNTDYNYIRKRDFCNEAGTKSVNTFAYFDGIGRKYQDIRQGASTNGKDLSVARQYDGMGREMDVFLPVQGYTTGLPLSMQDLQAELLRLYADSMAYTHTTYQQGMANRVSSVTGPGAAWHTACKAVKTEYLSNSTTNDSLICRKYQMVNEFEFKNTGNYDDAQLYVTKIIDEDGNVSLTFVDSQQRLLLARSYDRTTGEAGDTYYIYDAHGNLCKVLPPNASDLDGKSSRNYALITPSINDYAYSYKYDACQRQISRSLASRAPESTIYDRGGRPVLEQDGNMEEQSKWKYTYYTPFGEVAETGICHLNYELTEKLREYIHNFYATATYVKGEGYKYVTLPITREEVMTINYYDSYDFLHTPGFANDTLLTAGRWNAKGRLTGSSTSIFNSSDRIYTVYHYDDFGRISCTLSTNHLSGHDIVNTTYTFNGLPQIVETIHSSAYTPQRPVTEKYTYHYDDWGKLLKTEHTFNGKIITLCKQAYDAVERLITKETGTPSRSATYSYNLRGWLTDINHPKFKQHLYYTDGVNTPCFNGNISSMTWQSDKESTLRGYKYTYDGLSRLKNAIYGEGTELSVNTDRFNEEIPEYDKQGNILRLKRYGKTSQGTYGLINDLHSTFYGNKLMTVNNYAPNSVYAGGFSFLDLAFDDFEYFYDQNGNLERDLNRNIDRIEYNSLNLPDRVGFQVGGEIVNLYAADGSKLRAIHISNRDTLTTDYCGNAIYENGVLSTLLTEEGYISLSDTTYHYFVQDNQGNNRVVISQSGDVEEVNHYYPFGGIFELSSNVQPYKYNGKELDTFKKLNWHDYGARMYDATLGRWHSIDPMAEKYYASSPYNYCDNNPIGRSDPDGKDWIKDRFDYYLWDENSVNRETTREGWDYVGTELPDDVGRYRILEEIDGNLYHKNTINPFASFINWAYGEDLMVEKKAYEPAGEHMMQQGIETGAEFAVGEIGGKIGAKIFSKLFSRSTGKGFQTFTDFKKANGPAGEGMAWHHIVEQHGDNLANFGAEAIHNTNNLIRLPHGKGSIHANISGFYSSKPPFAEGMTVRKWLSSKSFQEQYKYGIETLKRYGWKP